MLQTPMWFNKEMVMKNTNKSVPVMAQNNRKLKLKPLKMALMVATLGVSASAMSAEVFNNGDYSFNIDTTVSYGASWRLANRDDRLIGKANINPFVGVDLSTGAASTLGQRIAAPGRWSINSDDGNLNYDQGDLISNALKFTSDLSFTGPTWGAFMRVTGFYDFENAENDKLSVFPDVCHRCEDDHHPNRRVLPAVTHCG